MISHEALAGVEVGTRFGPVEFVCSAERNEQYLYAEQDYHERYVSGARPEPAIVHPGLLLDVDLDALTSFHLAEGWWSVRARDQVEFSRPAFVGETLYMTSTIVDLYEKRGLHYYVRETIIRNAAGEEVVKMVVHSALRDGGR